MYNVSMWERLQVAEDIFYSAAQHYRPWYRGWWHIGAIRYYPSISLTDLSWVGLDRAELPLNYCRSRRKRQTQIDPSPTSPTSNLATHTNCGDQVGHGVMWTHLVVLVSVIVGHSIDSYKCYA